MKKEPRVTRLLSGPVTALFLYVAVISPATAQQVEGTLVQTIDASQFTPPSPDTAGATYLDFSNTILLSDGEVNEIPSLFTGDNLFEINSGGSLLDTLTTIPFSDEPAGLAYNPSNGHLFVADDTGARGIFEWNPGPDGIFDTVDDTTSFFRTSDFGAPDPEGLAFDSLQGRLYMVDGANSELYEIDPGVNGIFDGVPPAGDDVVTSHDTASLGVTDPEGLTYDTDSGHLYLIGKPEELLLHVTTSGTLVRSIDVSAANPRKPAGLAYAPSSVNPAEMNVYIVDRGVDNSFDPDENDGKVYEFSIPTISFGNLPPSVDAGPDLTVTLPDIAILDGTVSDDGHPGPLTTAWSVTSGPARVTSPDASAVDTTARFSSPGTYVLRLTADDSELDSSDETTVTVIGNGGERVVQARVAASSDDAEERIDTSVDLNSSDLEMVFDVGGNQTVGMRFAGLDVPRGSTINTAYLQFRAAETKSNVTALTIEGENVDNASTFFSANGNVSLRPRTIASVPWSPPAWTTVGEVGPPQRTPDIASVIQEIVSRPGWLSGNALVIIISGTGERAAEAFDGEELGAPLLHIEFVSEPLSIGPTSVTVAPGGSQSFAASGGGGSYGFALPVNNSGGTIDPVTGVYTAGPTGGVIDTVRVTDGLGTTADTTVTVNVVSASEPDVATTLSSGPLVESNGVLVPVPGVDQGPFIIGGHDQHWSFEISITESGENVSVRKAYVDALPLLYTLDPFGEQFATSGACGLDGICDGIVADPACPVTVEPPQLRLWSQTVIAVEPDGLEAGDTCTTIVYVKTWTRVFRDIRACQAVSLHDGSKLSYTFPFNDGVQIFDVDTNELLDGPIHPIRLTPIGCP